MDQYCPVDSLASIGNGRPVCFSALRPILDTIDFVMGYAPGQRFSAIGNDLTASQAEDARTEVLRNELRAHLELDFFAHLYTVRDAAGVFPRPSVTVKADKGFAIAKMDQIGNAYESNSDPTEAGSLELSLASKLASSQYLIVTGERGVGKSTSIRYVLSELVGSDTADRCCNPKMRGTKSYHLLDAHDLKALESTGSDAVLGQLYEVLYSELVEATPSAATYFTAWLLRQGAQTAAMFLADSHSVDLSVKKSVVKAREMRADSRWVTGYNLYKERDAGLRCGDIINFLTDYCEHSITVVVDNVDVWSDQTQVNVATKLRFLFETLADEIGLVICVRDENVTQVQKEMKAALLIRRTKLSNEEVRTRPDFFWEVVARRLTYLAKNREICDLVGQMVIRDPNLEALMEYAPALFEAGSTEPNVSMLLERIAEVLLVPRDSRLMLADLLDTYNGSLRIASYAIATLMLRTCDGSVSYVGLDQILSEKKFDGVARALRTMALRHATLYTLDRARTKPVPPNAMRIYDVSDFSISESPTSLRFVRWRILEYLGERSGTSPEWKDLDWYRRLRRIRDAGGVSQDRENATVSAGELIEAIHSFGPSRAVVERELREMARRRDELDEGVIRLRDLSYRLVRVEDASPESIKTLRVEILRPGFLLLGFLAQQSQYLFWSAASQTYESEAQARSLAFSNVGIEDAVGSEHLTALVGIQYLLNTIDPLYRSQFENLDGLSTAYLDSGKRIESLLENRVAGFRYMKRYVDAFGSDIMLSRTLLTCGRHLNRLIDDWPATHRSHLPRAKALAAELDESWKALRVARNLFADAVD